MSNSTNLSKSEYTDDIPLPYKYLNRNIKSHLWNQLKKTKVGNCSSKKGYIIDIEQKINILSNYISSASPSVTFKVKYTAIHILPKVGTEMIGKVCMILQHGVFILIEDKLKILIPFNKLSDFKYDNELSVFSNDDTTIGIEDTVKVLIQNIKYENKAFRCIGEYVEKI